MIQGAYLPLVMKRGVIAPDLIVDQLLVGREAITVVIRNIGPAPVVDAFWVDVYLDPEPPPARVNQIWPDLGDQGLVWGVTILPLKVGQPLTLTMTGPTYRADLSRFRPPLTRTALIYAQVDSVNRQTSFGGVLESHELIGRPYNNISSPAFGPNLSTPALSPPAPHLKLNRSRTLPDRLGKE
jgi:hypothetical protein